MDNEVVCPAACGAFSMIIIIVITVITIIFLVTRCGHIGDIIFIIAGGLGRGNINFIGHRGGPTFSHIARRHDYLGGFALGSVGKLFEISRVGKGRGDVIAVQVVAEAVFGGIGPDPGSGFAAAIRVAGGVGNRRRAGLDG